jgi:hypothetical protein
MGLLKSIRKAFKKTVKKALSGVQDNSPDKPKPMAEMGPQGDSAERARVAAARPRRARGARGRDSTIITAGSSIGSRTLLG